MKTEKPAVMKRQMDLLQGRYDLRNDPAPGVAMTGGKPVLPGNPHQFLFDMLYLANGVLFFVIGSWLIRSPRSVSG